MNDINYLGLDFGTSYSFLAYKPKGEPDPVFLLSDPERMNMARGIPSLFWYKKISNNNYKIIIGQEAEPALVNDPDNVVTSVKMQITNDEPIVLNGKSFTAQEIMDRIIEYIINNAKKAAEEKYKEFPKPGTVKIVTGVPVSFGDHERTLIYNAIKKQGYEAEFIPEPVAAALNHAKMEKENFANVLVCDVGAGTFDAAFLTVNTKITPDYQYPYRKLGSEGSNGREKDLAGDAIDKAFADYIIEHCSGNWTQSQINKVRDKNSKDYRGFMLRVRKIKERLSSERYVSEYVPIDRNPVEISVTLDDLEEAAKNITSEIADICYKVVKKCGMLEKSFPIILVGGSCNSPIIQNALAKRFPKQAEQGQIKLRCPSQAVVMGCAFYAESHELPHDVNYAYAVECYNDETQKQCLSIEIPAGVELPYKTESYYMTRHDNQTAIEFRIYEVPGVIDEDTVDVDKGLYKDIHVIHSFNQPVPRDTKVRFIIELTESGMLNVSVSDNGITSGTTRKGFNRGTVKGSGDNASKQKL